MIDGHNVLDGATQGDVNTVHAPYLMPQYDLASSDEGNPFHHDLGLD